MAKIGDECDLCGEGIFYTHDRTSCGCYDVTEWEEEDNGKVQNSKKDQNIP